MICCRIGSSCCGVTFRWYTFLDFTMVITFVCSVILQNAKIINYAWLMPHILYQELDTYMKHIFQIFSWLIVHDQWFTSVEYYQLLNNMQLTQYVHTSLQWLNLLLTNWVVFTCMVFLSLWRAMYCHSKLWFCIPGSWQFANTKCWKMTLQHQINTLTKLTSL